MCIPINLDVPVVTHDQHELGIARDIICACPGDYASHVASARNAFDAGSGENDLWRRVTRSAQPDLFIPFGEIAETRTDGVRLLSTLAALSLRAWERPPATLAIPA